MPREVKEAACSHPAEAAKQGTTATLGGKVRAASPPPLSQGDIVFKSRGKQNPTMSPYHMGLGV